MSNKYNSMENVKLHYSDNGRPKRLIGSRIETIADINDLVIEHRLRGNKSTDFYLNSAESYENIRGELVTNFELYELL